MSEGRTPMKPAAGLVKGRISTLPSRPRTVERSSETTPDVQVETPPAPVSAGIRAEEAKEAEFGQKVGDQTVELQVDASTPAGEPKPKRAPRTKVSETTGGTKRTTLSLPQELVDVLGERLKSTPRISRVQFILNALATTAPRLKELVEADNSDTVGNDLFPVISNVRASSGGSRTTIGFDTAAANMAVVNQLVTSSGAASRSQLVQVALRDVLGL